MPTRKHRHGMQEILRSYPPGVTDVPPLHLQVTPDLSIQLVRGELRNRAHTLLTHHYTKASGGAGRTYAVVTNSGEILGAVLIGGTTSELQSRSLIRGDVPVRVVKRLYCLDRCSIPESTLLRAAARDTANQLGQTCAIAAYAEPCARDSRTNTPMSGKVYANSSFFLAGSSGRRRALLDADGCVRSQRQGKQTLTLKTTPVGWQWIDLPPATIWMTIVTPQVVVHDGELRITSERWCKREWRRAWAAVPAQRKVAARQWIDHKTMAAPGARWTAGALAARSAHRSTEWSTSPKCIVARQGPQAHGRASISA